MIKAMRVGNTVICNIHGKMYKKTCESTEEILDLYDQALQTDDSNEEEVAELVAMMIPPKNQLELELERQEEELQDNQTLIEWMENIKNLGDEHFEVDGFKLYMKGINITVPEFLAKEFAVRREDQEDLTAMMNFWRLCALNPDPRCREDLFGFIQRNGLTLTQSGCFVAYRNANVKFAGSKEQNDIVAAAWLSKKLKGKNPEDYCVYYHYDDQEYNVKKIEKFINNWGEISDLEDDFPEINYLGNLEVLYHELKTSTERTVYTDAYSGTTEISIGTPVKLDRKDADANPERTCSKGLHVGNASWLRKDYFGSVGLVVLVNPMNAVSVPYEDYGKMRCIEYLPIALAEYNEEGYIKPVDVKTLDIDYVTQSQEELERLLSNSSLESLKEHEVLPKELSLSSLRQALTGLKGSLEEMTIIVNNRIRRV